MAGKLYGSVNSLTLDRFIKIVCEGDYSQLFIDPSDFVLTREVMQAWETIYEEFIDGLQDKEGMYKLRLIGKINNLEFTYQHIQLCVKYLSYAYDREIVQLLQRHVQVGNFNPEDLSGYRRDLQIVLNRAQGVLGTIEELKAELAIIQRTDMPGEKTSRKQFDQLITSVSIYAKFHIDKRVITVSEFIEYYISRKESIEAMEEQYQKHKG